MAQSKTLDKKSIEKKAKKALARAEKSVEAARKAVRASSKKLRGKAESLAKKTQKLGAKQAKAHRELASAESARATVVAEEQPGAVVTAPPLPTPEAAAPTLAELRRRAKEQGVTGYSRLNKSALIEALDSAPAE